jgi:hypothetical protein
MTHDLGPFDQCPVARDLIMLGGLRPGQQAGFEGRLVLDLFHQIVRFFGEAFDRRALLAFRLLADSLKNLFETLDLALRLLPMRLKKPWRAPTACRPPYIFGKALRIFFSA